MYIPFFCTVFILFIDICLIINFLFYKFTYYYYYCTCSCCIIFVIDV